MIAFDIGTSGQQLQISDPVLEHLDQHRQLRFWQREAGGLLFARFALPVIEVVEATGPRPTDRRRRHSYVPDPLAEQIEIETRFQELRHFVGCWHTHPEDIASPSDTDIRNTADCVRRSQHALHGFLMIIVGRTTRGGLFVSVCDGASAYQLHPRR